MIDDRDAIQRLTDIGELLPHSPNNIIFLKIYELLNEVIDQLKKNEELNTNMFNELKEMIKNNEQNGNHKK